MPIMPSAIPEPPSQSSLQRNCNLTPHWTFTPPTSQPPQKSSQKPISQKTDFDEHFTASTFVIAHSPQISRYPRPIPVPIKEKCPRLQSTHFPNFAIVSTIDCEISLISVPNYHHSWNISINPL